MVCQTKFPSFNSFSLVEYIVNPVVSQCGNSVFSWIAFNKLPENPVVTPSSSVQVVTPSAFNRYLQSVTVNAVSTPTP